MISPLMWCLIAYLSVGFYIMIEAIVVAWDIHPANNWIKALGSIIAILFWPLMFFI
jgi:hypothetical protein